jgi:hypothetical protein
MISTLPNIGIFRFDHDRNKMIAVDSYLIFSKSSWVSRLTDSKIFELETDTTQMFKCICENGLFSISTFALHNSKKEYVALPFSKIFLLDCRIVPRVWYIVVFHFIVINPSLFYLIKYCFVVFPPFLSDQLYVAYGYVIVML